MVYNMIDSLFDKGRMKKFDDLAKKQAKVCPYLLCNAVIDAPNQAWSMTLPIFQSGTDFCI